MTKKILLLPGDGIGVEVVEQARKIIDFLRSEGTGIEYEMALIGGSAISQVGEALPQSTLQLAKVSDAVLLGAVGGPQWDSLPHEQRPERGLMNIRKELRLFANLRPAKSYPSLQAASSIKAEILGGTDMLIVRELTGGLYYGEPRTIGVNQQGIRYGLNTTSYTEVEIRRVAQVAFESARNRKKKVVSTDKANVLEVSRFWREIVTDLAKQYPDVSLEHMYADNAAMQMVRQPQYFDVVLAPNVFGDLLSDLAAAIVGSIGLLPSASLNEKSLGLYEPVHGSAPDIAGKGIANPLATILSLAMLFRHSLSLDAIADRIEQAVERTIAQEILTADLMMYSQHKSRRPFTTEAVTYAVIENMKDSKRT
ncbi:MAG: 3-isopropylmalate dehydrogenase [Methylacidiphilales bacterium]|nr:3-isopropylmalate dehydrogenase [Candidatus Methylacidiphilales bacterium]